MSLPLSSEISRLPGLVCVCALLVCARAVCLAGAAESGGSPLNLVIVSLNSLRADHLKVYGYGKETAPNISRLAEESAVFERAVAQSHWTLPSLASLFTSKYVHSHGLYERGGKLSEKELTLAEMLKERGYRTAAFTGGLDMSAAYGLNQGFDVYFDDTGEEPMGSFNEIMPKALDWLAAHKNDRFFLFVDSYDIHPPFDKSVFADAAAARPGSAVPEYAGVLKGRILDYNLLKDFKNGELPLDGRKTRLDKEDIAYIISRYDAGIAYADRFIGGLLAKLDGLGLSKNTVLALVSEHGEELGDHGGFDRFGRKNLYEESIRVPLMIRNPRTNSKGRVAAQAQLIDVMPTVLDMLEIPAPGGLQGASLAPLIGSPNAGKDFNRHVYSEAGFHKWTVRAGNKWKLIYDSGRYELFDLARDGSETENIAGKTPGAVYELAQELMKWRRRTRTDKSPDDTRTALTEDMKRKLKEAGYWR